MLLAFRLFRWLLALDQLFGGCVSRVVPTFALKFLMIKLATEKKETISKESRSDMQKGSKKRKMSTMTTGSPNHAR
ncbi:hypothetical protein V8E53_013639 [Lactarius tabidus]